MALVKRYEYQPLESITDIRLVVLETAERFSDPLKCSIIHQPKVQTSEYDAISYTWGEPSFTHTLRIQDSSGAKFHLHITSNVDSALRHLRCLRDQLIPLWIDAICLNQQDVEEKAHQIPMMGRIYSQAKTVRIWLGDEDKDTPILFRELQERTGEQQEFNSGSFRSPGQLRESFERLFLWRPVKQRFARFSQRPWFSRRWTIQEACLAKNARLHCGSLEMPLWRLVITAEHFLRIHNSDGNSHSLNTYPIEMISHLSQSTSGLSILNLLQRFHRAECLEPRDRVAALYGLLTTNHLIPLDFSVHWTQLYRDLATNILTGVDDESKLDLLLHLFEFGPIPNNIDMSSSVTATSASWIPNWSNCRKWKLPLLSTARKTEWTDIFAKSPKIQPPPSLSVCTEEATAQISWDIPSYDLDPCQISSLECCQQVARTWQLDDEWKQNLDPEGKVGTFSAQRETQTALFISILDEVFTRGGAEWQQNFVAVCFLIHTFIVVLTLVDYDAGDWRVRSHLENKYKGIEHILDFDTIQFGVLSKLPNLMLHFSFFTVTQGHDEKSALRHGSGVTSAFYGFSYHQVAVGDILVPLWDVHLKHYRYVQRYIIDSMGSERAALVTMLVIRPEVSTDQTSSSNQDPSCEHSTEAEKQKLPLPTGRIIGPAVCVYFKEGPGSRDSKFRRCTMLLN